MRHEFVVKPKIILRTYAHDGRIGSADREWGLEQVHGSW